jgi:hypothetical protein
MFRRVLKSTTRRVAMRGTLPPGFRVITMKHTKFQSQKSLTSQ